MDPAITGNSSGPRGSDIYDAAAASIKCKPRAIGAHPGPNGQPGPNLPAAQSPGSNIGLPQLARKRRAVGWHWRRVALASRQCTGKMPVPPLDAPGKDYSISLSVA